MPSMTSLAIAGRESLDHATGSEPDETCMARVVARDSTAFATVYDRYGPMVYSLALRIVREPHIAEDVTQDVFLSLWRLASRFDATRGSLQTYILSMTHHRAVDVVRGARRDLQTDPNDLATSRMLPDQQNVEYEVLRRIEARKLRAALRVLNADQRTAIDLAYFGGYSYPEIATMLQIPLGTVKSRLRLALAKLRAAEDINSLTTAG